MKVRDIGCLVKGPGARHSKAVEIDAPDRLAEGQHSVEQLQRKSQYLARIGVRPVMRVVKQRAKSEFAL